MYKVAHTLSLPGAIGMYGLSLGVSQIGETLPAPVYALLSGLNAATVGIIALAAVNLAEKAITDKLTRVLVFLGGVGGMLYTALWYYPILMIGAGVATVVWDYRWLHRLFRRRRLDDSEQVPAQDVPATAATLTTSTDLPTRRSSTTDQQPFQTLTEDARPTSEASRIIPQSLQINILSWKSGTLILALFILSFLTILLLRSLLHTPPLALSLFANLYLAGTIIFGGGPVVIPLLREYIVAEHWVSPRDFLLGLAIIQAFPGPNFNFAVYLGALSASNSHHLPSIVGAFLGFIGIFTPGIVIVTGVMGLWSVLRGRRWLMSLLRGVNAGAVGLVFTAVYKLWQVGYVGSKTGIGGPLGGDPWWVAVTAGAFVGGRWFGVSAPVAILCGGTLGVVWWAVVES